ncbi:MAG: DUF1700 domain-containing protein [Clostridia bacterium]|nr:DUF1700 domain-containing protein [Clostridia bacterium]
MNKQEFILNLKAKLSGLPRQEVEERLSFYSEMLDDKTEEGLKEEEAVAQLGSVDEVASQIIADIPLIKIATEKIKPKRRLKAWEIVLLALGSPIWISLIITAFAVIISLYVSIWSAVVALWAAFGAFVGCAIGCIAVGTVFTIGTNALTGLAIISAGLVCAGLAIFLFFGCKAATKGVIALTPQIALGIKKCFAVKEKA